MVIDLNDTYRMMTTVMMKTQIGNRSKNDNYGMMIRTIIMIRMMKTKNGHNLANFEAITSRFCMIIDLNYTYRMMRIMIMTMKTQNGHNSTNFEATTSTFGRLIDIKNTYRLYFQTQS